MLRKICRAKLPVLFALAALLAAPAFAAPVGGGVADVLLGTTQVEWVPVNGQATMHLVVSGPDGVVETTFAAGDTPRFDLAALAGDVDGSYSWQLTASPELSAESRRLMAQARNEGSPFVPNDLPPREQLVQSGHFRVVDGGIVQPTADPEPELSIATGGGDSVGVASDGVQVMTAADQVILDDLIVDGSLCVGMDCVNGESFGFDTIRLKENNLRIKFLDTSTGTFPSNDWQITINDSSNGGPSYYRIDDVTNNRVPFTIEANTPTNTLYVDQTGRIGVGTNVPVVEVHVQDGDSPSLRLQQDGSSGFAQQIWDVVGNEANFFVRDTTNGSKLPFRIKPGAPNNSVFIAADGDVGMGTDSPSVAMHVYGTDGNTSLAVEEASATQASRSLMALKNNGQLNFSLERSDAGSGTWTFTHNGSNIAITKVGTGANEFSIDENGNVEARGTITGSVANPSSASLKTDFGLVDGRDILERLRELPVKQWEYKTTVGRTHLGPMAEDFAETFGVGDGERIYTVDADGVALAAIQGLLEIVEERDAQVNRLEAELQELRSAVVALSQSAH